MYSKKTITQMNDNPFAIKEQPREGIRLPAHYGGTAFSGNLEKGNRLSPTENGIEGEKGKLIATPPRTYRKSTPSASVGHTSKSPSAFLSNEGTTHEERQKTLLMADENGGHTQDDAKNEVEAPPCNEDENERHTDEEEDEITQNERDEKVEKTEGNTVAATSADARTGILPALGSIGREELLLLLLALLLQNEESGDNMLSLLLLGLLFLK